MLWYGRAKELARHCPGARDAVGQRNAVPDHAPLGSTTVNGVTRARVIRSVADWDRQIGAVHLLGADVGGMTFAGTVGQHVSAIRRARRGRAEEFKDVQEAEEASAKMRAGQRIVPRQRELTLLTPESVKRSTDATQLVRYSRDS